MGRRSRMVEKQMADEKDKQYVFGPVPSRRLGRSLGIDLIPYKTCTFDCIYCQLGRTTNLTAERREYVPMDTVLAQIGRAVERGPKPDYITLAGSGEPTLYSRMGELIDGIHKITDVPVDILTNGSLLYDDAVLRDASKAELIIPSLDIGDEEMLRKINRPVGEITFDKLTAGLKNLCEQCREKVWIEVFLVRGINDSLTEVEKIANIINKLRPAKVQLNTAVRPTAESYANAISKNDLESFAEMFHPRAEVIAEFPEADFTEQTEATSDAILEMLRRRPCTLDDIVAGMNVIRNEAIKIIEVLTREEKIQTETREGKHYYFVR